ncbi:HPr family phosphocarrier protein [soil metagenome]
MISRDVTVVNRAGIHTRPASMIVRTASRFKAECYLRKDGYEINAKSIIGVMTLAAEHGATLELVLDGPDEEAAIKELVELFAGGFGEVAQPNE